MGTCNYLGVRGQDSLHQGSMFNWRHLSVSGKPSQVVHAFKDDDPSYIRGRQHIAIEPRQDIRPQAIG